MPHDFLSASQVRCSLDHGAVTESLFRDSGAAVMVMCRHLHYLAVNDIAARVLGKRPDEMIGRCLRDFFAPEVYENVRANAERVLATEHEHSHFTIVRGMGWRTTMRPVHWQDGSGERQPAVLLVSAPYNDLTESLWAEESMALSAQPDRSSLPVLTDRERKVLRLIGHGHSIEAVARLMFRSIKTIESIRTALTKKLNAKSRIDLARIAMRLGPIYDLLPLDADEALAVAPRAAGPVDCECPPGFARG